MGFVARRSSGRLLTDGSWFDSRRARSEPGSPPGRSCPLQGRREGFDSPALHHADDADAVRHLASTQEQRGFESLHPLSVAGFWERRRLQPGEGAFDSRSRLSCGAVQAGTPTGAHIPGQPGSTPGTAIAHGPQGGAVPYTDGAGGSSPSPCNPTTARWWNGRHAGFRFRCLRGVAGSTPALVIVGACSGGGRHARLLPGSSFTGRRFDSGTLLRKRREVVRAKRDSRLFRSSGGARGGQSPSRPRGLRSGT